MRSVLVVGVLAAVLLIPAAAQASVSHTFLYRFQGGSTTPPAPNGNFGPTGVAVDNSASASSGKLWASSPKVVDKFSPSASGTSYLCQVTGLGSATTSGSECDSSQPGPGAFTQLLSVAVDPSTGALYAGDFGTLSSPHLVDEFTAGGAYQQQVNLGSGRPVRIAAGADAVFIADSVNKQIDEWVPSTNTLSTLIPGSNAPSGAFGTVNGVAVDTDPSSSSFGDIYVADSSNHVVDKFTAAGTYVCQITGKGSATTSASECDSSGPGLAKGALGFLGALAVDPANGHLYVADSPAGVAPQIDEFDSAGSLLGSFTGAATPAGYFVPSSIAISTATGDIFVGDPAHSTVDVYANDTPNATTGAPLNVTPTSATLNGTVNPEGFSVSDCHFEYGTDTSYGTSVPCVETVGSGTSDVSVHADVTGLTAGQTYHYRLVAGNANGTSDGADQFEGGAEITGTHADSITPNGAKLHATINPANSDTSYQFQYGTTSSYGQSIPATPADIGSGSTSVAVTQTSPALTPNTTYHFRAVATNAAGTADGPDQTFTTLTPALIDVQPPTGMSNANGLAPGAATLHAYINPQGADTTYHFEYGTTTSYGNSTSGADAGSGTTPQAASAAISGLAPNATYHYRTDVTNSYGSYQGPDSTFTTPPASCPNASFRAGLSATLPDCRAYEQVSPQDKAGYPAEHPELAPAGDRVEFLSSGAFAGSPSAGVLGNNYLAVRGSGGWGTQSLNPPASLGDPTANLAGTLGGSTPDLARFDTTMLSPASRTGGAASISVYLRSPDGTFAAVTPALSPLNGSFTGNASAVAGTPDLSDLVIQSYDPLLASDTGPDGYERLYEVVGATGSSPAVRLLSLDTSGNSNPCTGGSTSTAELGNGIATSFPEAISQDGSRVFYQLDPGGPGCTQSTWQLYARVNGQSTVQLSAPSPSECTTSACQSAPATGPSSGAHFEGAPADGSKTFFTSTRQLTDNASEDSTESANSNLSGATCASAQLSGCNLYEYDFNRPAGSNLVNLSAGDMSGLGPQVRAVVQVAPDGSRVYFIASGVLTSQPNQLGQTAQAGAENLYVYDTDTGTASFLAELCSRASQSGSVSGVASCPGSGTDIGSDPTAFARGSDVTPDGRYLTFSSYAQMTPDDTNQAADVYEYDAQTGSLVRLSVGHDGQDQNGNGGGQDATAQPLATLLTRVNHVLSADGQTVVFTTARPLQTGAVNGQPDVYEWHQGEVTLVSGGGSANPVSGAAIDASGQNITFATDQGLLPQDTDGLTDVYDARVDGGFPAPPAAPGACSGDACQGSPSTEPPLPTAASVSFTGPGNQTPAAGPASPGRPRVLTRTVRGNSFLVNVRVPAAGRIAITGNGIKPVGGRAPKAGVYRLRVSLTPAARRLLARKHLLRLRLRVGYTPAGSAPQAATVRITVKPTLARHHGTTRSSRRVSHGTGGAR